MNSSFPLCASPVWDVSLSWNTNRPDLTACFYYVVMPLGLIGYCLLMFIPTVAFLATELIRGRVRQRAAVRQVDWVMLTRLLLSLLFSLMTLIDFVTSIMLTDKHLELRLHSAFLFVAMTSVCGVHALEIRKQRATSGATFLFWLLALTHFCLALQSETRTLYLYQFWPQKFALLIAYTILSLIGLLASTVSGLTTTTSTTAPGSNAAVCPELTANYLSRLSFWWITPLIISGYKRPLTYASLFELNSRDNCVNLFPRFKRAWNACVRVATEAKLKTVTDSANGSGKTTNRLRFTNRLISEDSSAGVPAEDLVSMKSVGCDNAELEKSEQPIKSLPATVTTDAKPDTTAAADEADAAAERPPPTDSTKLCPEQKEEPTEKPKDMFNPIVLKVLFRMFAPSILLSVALKFFYDLLNFAGTIILKAILKYLQSGAIFEWRGYFYVGLIFLSGILQTAILHQYFHIVFVLGMQIRTSLVCAVYKKSLKLSNQARKTTTTGSIVNLMSVDSFKFQELMSYINILWSGPLQIFICLVLLYQELGPSIFAGVAVLIILIPFNGVLAKYMKQFQVQQMELKDTRIKMISEILAGIRVIKLYAWELAFAQQVSATRKKEIAVMRRSAFLNAGISFAWSCTPVLVSLATFSVYTFSSADNILDAEKCFVSISLFNLLRFPLAILPMVANSTVECSVSLKRLTNFLTLDELDKGAVKRRPDQKPALRIVAGLFSWESSNSGVANPTLSDVNLEVKDGALVAIVGKVGAGKSSLLNALLGYITKLNGSVSVKGSLAYVSQEPFIQNLSLRDNVLFNTPMRDDLYRRVIDCCALERDLEILQAGDMTEIGEKGITLSGGQKARVSLARACYADKDIYLLDDPLSAVDVHVGKHIFERVISSENGLLRRKTRVLVTHSLTYLPRVDQIIVLNDGRISEIGTFRELVKADGPFSRLISQFLASHYPQTSSCSATSAAVASSSAVKEDSQLPAPVGDVDTVLNILDEIQKEEMEKDLTVGQDQNVVDAMATIPDADALAATALAAVGKMPAAAGQDAAQLTGEEAGPDADAVKTPLLAASSKQQLPTAAAAAAAAAAERSVSINGPAEKAADSTKVSSPTAVFKTTEEEKSKTGRVNWRVYLTYFRAVGLLFCLGVFVTYIIAHGLSLGSNFWLVDWTNDARRSTATTNSSANDSTTAPTLAGSWTRPQRIGILAMFGLLQAGHTALGMLGIWLCAARASRRLHDALLRSLMRQPVHAHERRVSGRTINAFSGDVSRLDNMMPRRWKWVIQSCFWVFENFFGLTIVTLLRPSPLLPLAIVVCAPFYLVQVAGSCVE